MENSAIAGIFDEIADLLDLQDGNQFRIRSYRSAARTVRDLSPRLEDLVEQDQDLTEIPNIGDSTADKIHEIIDTGTCERLEELKKKVPEGLTRVMDVPQLGPKKAMQLHEALGIEDLDDLREASENQEVRDVEGMGAKTEENILEGLRLLEQTADRVLYKDAQDHVTALSRHLDGLDAVRRWEVAGSFRRRKATIGDLDVLIETKDRDAATDKILEYDAIDSVLSRGEEKVSVRLGDGLQVDFRFFENADFGSAFLYFTGSRAHNITLRKRAQARDWKLNEYGLLKGDHRLAGQSEESVYHRLDLPWIPPELREDRGEIAAANDDALPDLIEPGDLRGDLQSHTDATDGAASVEDIAEAAHDRGHAFYAITDHSKRVTMAGGLDEDALKRHADHIREINEKYHDMWLMAGVEVDILKSGKLDLDEKALADLDWVVASIHYDMDLSEPKMTDRLVAAISSGVVHVIGHPLNRIIGKREGIRFDLDRVLEACVDNDVRLEINAQPDRLDLPDTYCKRARDAGVGFTIGSDAHKPSDLDLLPFGVDVARRGWLRREDVLNTRTKRQIEKELGRG